MKPADVHSIMNFWATRFSAVGPPLMRRSSRTESNQLLRLADGKRTQEERVHKRENCRCAGDA